MAEFVDAGLASVREVVMPRAVSPLRDVKAIVGLTRIFRRSGRIPASLLRSDGRAPAAHPPRRISLCLIGSGSVGATGSRHPIHGVCGRGRGGRDGSTCRHRRCRQTESRDGTKRVTRRRRVESLYNYNRLFDAHLDWYGIRRT